MRTLINNIFSNFVVVNYKNKNILVSKNNAFSLIAEYILETTGKVVYPKSGVNYLKELETYFEIVECDFKNIRIIEKRHFSVAYADDSKRLSDRYSVETEYYVYSNAIIKHQDSDYFVLGANNNYYVDNLFIDNIKIDVNETSFLRELKALYNNQ